MNSRVLDARKKDNQHILTVDEEEQLEEEMMQKMMDIEDVEFEELV